MKNSSSSSILQYSGFVLYFSGLDAQRRGQLGKEVPSFFASVIRVCYVEFGKWIASRFVLENYYLFFRYLFNHY